MNRTKIKMNKNLLIVLAFLLFNIIGYGQNTWLGNTQAWDLATNWSSGARPLPDDDVLIPNVPIQPVITSNVRCNSIKLSNSVSGGVTSLTINGVGLLTVNSIEMMAIGRSSLYISTGKIIVKDDIVMHGSSLQNDITFTGAGSITIGGKISGGKLVAGPGSVNYNGETLTQEVGDYTYNDLTLSGSGTKTIKSNTTVTDILSMEGTATTSASPKYGPGATLRYNSIQSHAAGPEWLSLFDAAGGIIIVGTGPVTITGVNKVLGDNIPLTISDGASLLISGQSDFSLGGDFMNDGSLTSDGLVYISGDAEIQSIDGFTSKGVVMSKNQGIATFTQSMSSEKLEISGSGTLNLGNGTRSLTHQFTDWIRTQGTLNGGTSLFKISGNVIGTGGVFIPGTGTVEFNGQSQNLGSEPLTYNNLVLSQGGTKTFGAKTTINETFSIATLVVADLAPNLVHSAKYIKLGDAAVSSGSWGSLASNAVNKNNTFFVSNNGIVNVGPTIVISTESLPALTTVYGTPSEPTIFNVAGIAMLEGILVTPSAEFEVSKDGINYTQTVTIGIAGDFGSAPLYIRLKKTTAAGTYPLGKVTLTSNNTTTINVPIAESVVTKALLKITVDGGISKMYGEENPTFPFTYSGFQNEDTADSLLTKPVPTTTADATSIVGIYNIAIGGGESNNYEFYYIGGILIVNPSNNAGLIDLSISQGILSPAFSVAELQYATTVQNDVTTIKLTPVTENLYATVKINGVPVASATASGEISLQVGQNKIVTEVTAQDGTIKEYIVIVTREPSSNAGLSDIVISNGDLNPAFDTNEKDYKVEVPNEINTYVINPIPADPTATIEMKVDGKVIDPLSPIDLKVGDNVITIVVTAEDGITQESYEVIVTRDPSNNSALIDLALSEGILTPAFTEANTAYTASVTNDIATINVTPVTSDSTATLTINGKEVLSGTASGEIPLQVGENTITTVVKAQDGTITTYTVIVTRAPSNNSGLIDLALSEGILAPAFTEANTAYTASVTNDIATINITPVTSDSTATLTINGKEVLSGTASGEIPLQVGENTITTIVKAQDGTITTYTVIVTRDPAPASDNAGLSDIVISDGALSPAFNTDTKGYTVEVPNEINTYVINPIPVDPTATIEMKVDGKIIDPLSPLDLKVEDNVITIVVTAEDGITQETYEIIVTRDPSNNSGLTDLALSEGTLSPAFTEGNTAYSATVPNDVTSIAATPVTADTTATITVNGQEVPSGTASGQIPLQVGENTITTVVKAQDGTITTYTVIVTREEAPAPDNAGLSDIVISDGALSPAFNTDTNDYKVEVPNEINTYVINPITIDPTATIEIKVDGKIIDPKSPIDLNVGENVITIVVTAEDGTQETYTVIVDRADAVPQAIIPTNIITPNGDGKNDYWIVPGIELFSNNSVKVFDRAARLVYSKNNYNNDWDGSYNGAPLTQDTYYYLIDLGNGQPKIKGFISIIRD
ncbi:hypothetical protein ASF10_20530 [Flavobacterium sp. Leaf82]|uniref:cadherin-like beta sandwich domain-containing protein n=1 Tax=Flavobacterium sp. Leaf82 TaxID=1736238 RepID=UPI0006F77D5B|nr:cadherin-like beta sandwich domain-containing protein [Flavobacterium sp. Leaf82]KQO32842.1 hypothetical protein ASF10_20530 [Flavobacterium sp. Leaf82]